MATHHIDGIEIASLWPEHYVDLTNLALARYFPEAAPWTALATSLHEGAKWPALTKEQIGHSQNDWQALPYLLGWHAPERLEQLIHREWLDAPTNEFAEHEAVLRELDALEHSQATLVAGAGVCRFADWLVKRSSTVQVRCADLSLFAIAAGRLLLQGRGDELPSGLRQPCEQVIERGPKGLRFAQSPLHYIGGGGVERIECCVNDCYALENPAQIDTIALLYVLDVPPFFDTMLVRILERLRPGQRLVFLTNVTARRDPRLILATLAALGVAVEQTRLCDLPYSLSRHDFALTRAICPTLVVQARVERPFDATKVRVYATAKLETIVEVIAKPIFAGQRCFPLALGDLSQAVQRQRLARVLAHAFAEKPYPRFRQILAEAFGEAQVEPIVAYLCTRCMAMLTCVRGVP